MNLALLDGLYAYDVDSERYWPVLDYEYVSGQRTVQVDGRGPCRLGRGSRVPRVRLRRLDGFTEAPLFEHEAAIDDVRASPDGAKVAVLYAATLLVVDSAGGQELRSVSLALPLGGLATP